MKILVAAHKPYDFSSYPDIYYPIKVGKFNDSKEYEFLNDNVGDNISQKNSTFCELTALYWGWKNLNTDISGLCHYRRYFVKSLNSFFLGKKQVIDKKFIKKVLRSKKIIIPKLGYRCVNQPKLYKNKEKKDQDYYLLETEKIISNCCPKYLKSWNVFAYGYKVAWGNMFILNKNYYDEYCEWLFPILFELEKQCIKENKVTPRLFGYISEILLCTWVYTKFKRKEIKNLDVINTEEKEKMHFLKTILRFLGLFSILKHIIYNIRYKKHNY